MSEGLEGLALLKELPDDWHKTTDPEGYRLTAQILAVAPTSSATPIRADGPHRAGGVDGASEVHASASPSGTARDAQRSAARRPSPRSTKKKARSSAITAGRARDGEDESPHREAV